jgi:hypothetical protein
MLLPRRHHWAGSGKLLYTEMVESLAQALKQTSREATILIYATARDPHLQNLTEPG